MKRIVFVISVFSMLALLAAGCAEKKAPAVKPKLEIQTIPEGASVSMFGKVYGKTPFKCSLKPETYIATIELRGFRTELVKLDIKPGADKKVRLKLKPETASVLLTSVPSAASVTFHGRKIGETPLVIRDLPVGEYSAELNKSGCSRRTVSWTIENARPLQLKTDLTSNVGLLRISSRPSGASVTVDGVVMGRTPFAEQLEEGKHEVVLTKSGYAALKQVVTVVRRKETVVKNAVLEILPGSLRITSSPSGAKVFVNDKAYADTPVELKQLPPGIYKIRIEKDGFDAALRDVTVTPGSRLEVALNLDSNTGGIDLVTAPGHITVYLDGRMVGTSQPDPENPGYSKVLSLRHLGMGKHSLTVAHKRARPPKRTIAFEIAKGEVKRLPNFSLWIPDVRLKLKSGDVREGRLSADLPQTIMFEPEPGVKIAYKKADISSMEKLKADE